MYPLRMTRSLAVVAGVAALAFPSAASAAELNVSPQKSCYSSGESINLLGTGFSPLGSASVTRDGSLLGALTVDGSGAFNGILTLAQNSGKQTKTYTATDGTDPSITASKQIVVSSVRVGLKPASGAPGRILRINARGFTTGKTLWAHIKRGKSRRTIKLGRLKGACGTLQTRKRLLPQDAALGVHTLQFDTSRRYNPKQPVRDRYTITVTRG
jgi:hypothetical protein